VRHGQIAANVQRLWHGSTDSDLTEVGVAQAACVARLLAGEAAGARAIFASPLRRARATAEPIAAALGLSLRIDPGLAEYSLGRREGERYEVLLQEGFFARIDADPDHAPPEGESPRAVAARVIGALERAEREHSEGTIVVVSHGAALGLALAQLVTGELRTWVNYQMRNCAVTELTLRPKPELVRFDATGHLRDA